MTLASQEYWQSVWEETRPQRGFGYFNDVAKHLPLATPTTELSFLEIGCAPGGILAEFCVRLGYTAYGLDYTLSPQKIEAYLRSEGVKVGRVYQNDFLSWQPERQFDVVASFGFIEHFDDPAAVVDRHFELVRPGGYVVITLPNLARGQKIMHWLFDRESLKIHNTRCMNLLFLREAAYRNKACVLEACYAGGKFGFFCDEKQPRAWLAERLMWRTARILKHLCKIIPGEVNPWFSPYMIAVYQANCESLAERKVSHP
jgi:2-polyprenyl-3-methyl-5-hydroxy-6-metoxy-1,4-benzoquinol methylase